MSKREDFVQAYLRLRDNPEQDRKIKERYQLSDARKEHAMLLHCEGLTFIEIGKRLGVSRSYAADMSKKATQKLNKAMRRTKLRYEALK